MGWFSRHTVDVDFGVDVVHFRHNGRAFDLTPTLHVAPDRRRGETLRRVCAIGDRDGFPPDAVHIPLLRDATLPQDVADAKQEYFAVWWRVVFELFLARESLIWRKPFVRVLVRESANDATRGDAAAIIRKAALAGGAHSVDITLERGGGHTARTG